ncbi:MAG: hypothetical protein HYZ13_12910 [Acidobacteria bacterium]|nr:hypothetical protein [Acidobacteriota bacterium]
MKTAAGFESASPETLAFRALPPGLRASPTLVESLEVKNGGSGEVQLTYLTDGLSWSVQYTGTYHPHQDRLDLQALVTLTNESVETFPEAHLQLVAGDPNLVPDPDPEPSDPDVTQVDKTSTTTAATVAPSFDEDKLADYHLYTLDRPTTLAQGQTKQVRLFQVEGIPVNRLHRADLFNDGFPEDLPTTEAHAFLAQTQSAEALAWEALNVQAGLAWINDEASGLGRPLPEGQLQLAEARPDGALIPLEPLPFESLSRGERIECWPGSARSWAGQRRLANIRKSRKGVEMTWEVDLRHLSSDPTPLVLRQWMEPGWILVRSNLPSERPSSNQIRFTIPPPSNGTQQLSYTVRIPWRPRR